MIKLYGIPNCDTVKKARSWLAENGIEFEFVDFKKNAPTVDLIDGWRRRLWKFCSIKEARLGASWIKMRKNLPSQKKVRLL